MVRSVLGKVMWVGRATVFLVGLAVILGLLFGVASTAFGANGDTLVLGSLENRANDITRLIGNVSSGPALQVANNNTAAGSRALQLTVAQGKAPILVNPTAGKATNLDADKLDGIDSNDLIKRGHPGSASTRNLNFYSYFMGTTSGVSDFPFGWAKLQTTGSTGQFKVCGNIPGSILSFNYVVYVNGARFTGTVSANNGCSQTFDVGTGGDFRVSIARAQIFGAPSDSFTNNSYALYGFSQL